MQVDLMIDKGTQWLSRLGQVIGHLIIDKVTPMGVKVRSSYRACVGQSLMERAFILT